MSLSVHSPAKALVASLLMAGPCSAVTALWQADIEQIFPGYVRDSRVAHLETPPGPSVSFHPGDDLWDISYLGDQIGWEWVQHDDPPWIVWNATTQTIVAHADWARILRLDRKLARALPLQVRTILELTRADGSPPRRVTLTTHSGSSATIGIDDLEYRIDPVANAAGFAFLKVSANWTSPSDGFHWLVDTSANFKNGQKILLARQGVAGKAWTLSASAELESTRGTPLSEVRQIEDGGKIQPWPRQRLRHGEVRLPVDESHGAQFSFIPSGAMDDLIKGLRVPDNYPLPEIEPPEKLNPWARSYFTDLSSFIDCKGAPDPPVFFAGYNEPASQLLVVDRPVNFDQWSILTSEYDPTEDANLWVETDPGSGFWGLTTQSGLPGKITRSKEGAESLAFEISDQQVAERNFISFTCHMDLLPDDVSKGRIGSSFEVPNGQPAVVGDFPGADGEPAPLQLTAKSSDPDQ